VNAQTNIIALRSRAVEPVPPATREMLVQEMANHLYAGVLGGLNTANDQDVISYLWNAPQRYHHRLVLDHMDEALYLAKQMLLAEEMSNG
jgi:hypothetical protein